MEIAYLIALGFVVRAVISAINSARTSTVSIVSGPKSICVGCAYAHIARDFESRDQMTFCTYVGASREIEFAVSNCTMFCDRNASTVIVRVFGFAETTVSQPISPSVAAELRD